MAAASNAATLAVAHLASTKCPQLRTELHAVACQSGSCQCCQDPTVVAAQRFEDRLIEALSALNMIESEHHKRYMQVEGRKELDCDRQVPLGLL